MSRSRTMGAGLASSTMYSNVAQLQIGDKLQGGAPLGTGYFKAKYTGRNYRTRTDGDNKNVIFCMNRMGGVGRGRSQFNVAGVNLPDGTRPCIPFRANNNITRNIYNVRTAVVQAKAYAKSKGLDLCLVGTNETIESDLGVSNGVITKLGNNVPGVKVINSLELVYYVKGKLQKHVAAMVTRDIAIQLLKNRFGIIVGQLGLIAFGCSTCPYNSYGAGNVGDVLGDASEDLFSSFVSFGSWLWGDDCTKPMGPC